MCDALKLISESARSYKIVFCCHPNPVIRQEIAKSLDNLDNIFLFGPQRYDVFIYLLKNSSFVISDSGGIQEEITALGKRMLITRDTTERQEAVDSGHAILTGTDPENIYKQAMHLISNKSSFIDGSPFGDGNTAKTIVDFYENNLN